MPSRCLLHTQSVHNTTQLLCLGIIHLFLKTMHWAKGRQEKKTKQKVLSSYIISLGGRPLGVEVQ